MFGPRGVGKSTLLKEHFGSKSTLWINLLDQKTELALAQNPDSLLDLWRANQKDWVIIDEVQKIPRILDVVHKLIEEQKVKFALTGSSARKLKRGGANLLAGRAVERHLSAFTSLELGSNFELSKALELGLLPTIWDQNLNGAEASDYLYSYVNTYLKEEIAAEQLVRNLDPFRRFLVAAAQSNGKIINHSAIERDSGVGRKQSERHFEILVDTLIGNYLVPFHSSIRKRQTLKSKFYFFDTGVVRTLKRVAGLSIEESTFEYGDLFETFIINELYKLNEALQKKWELSYYQTQNNLEIDLIIDRPKGKPILIEIKSASKVDESALSSYARLISDLPHEAAYLLSNDNREFEREGVRCLPWQKGMNEIISL